jgi:hypothetical protein
MQTMGGAGKGAPLVSKRSIDSHGLSVESPEASHGTHGAIEEVFHLQMPESPSVIQ